MKKIEKERRKNEYNIQSINNHLTNIFLNFAGLVFTLN